MSVLFWDRFKLKEQSTGIASYAERLIRKVVNTQQRKYIAKLSNDNLFLSAKVDERVIVSLTTFPARIHYVDLAIKSLIHQTIRPKKIVLWLAKEQFAELEIPDKLTRLCEYGLEIRYCEEDILAHKKYYYSMLEYPEDIIVTYDDDLIYPEDSIEKLLKYHELYPQYIVCNRGRVIDIKDNQIQPYDKWNVASNQFECGKPSYRIMASTGAGTLYPPSCMPKEAFNIEKIRALSLTADDLWMKAMSIYAGVPVVKSQKHNKALCLSVPEQKVSLARTNVDGGKNNLIFKNLLMAYPLIHERLVEDDHQ